MLKAGDPLDGCEKKSTKYNSNRQKKPRPAGRRAGEKKLQHRRDGRCCRGGEKKSSAAVSVSAADEEAVGGAGAPARGADLIIRDGLPA